MGGSQSLIQSNGTITTVFGGTSFGTKIKSKYPSPSCCLLYKTNQQTKKKKKKKTQSKTGKIFWEGGVLLLGWKTEPNQTAIFPELLMFPKICLSPSGSGCLEPEASSCLSERVCFIKSLSKLYVPP